MQPLVGSVVAALYVDAGGERRGHHIRLDDTNQPHCVEHLIPNCHACGRMPAQWEEDKKTVEAFGGVPPQCEAFVPYPPCGCDLPKGEELP